MASVKTILKIFFFQIGVMRVQNGAGGKKELHKDWNSLCEGGNGRASWLYSENYAEKKEFTRMIENEQSQRISCRAKKLEGTCRQVWIGSARDRLVYCRGDGQGGE